MRLGNKVIGKRCESQSAVQTLIFRAFSDVEKPFSFSDLKPPNQKIKKGFSTSKKARIRSLNARNLLLNLLLAE